MKLELKITFTDQFCKNKIASKAEKGNLKKERTTENHIREKHKQ